MAIETKVQIEALTLSYPVLKSLLEFCPLALQKIVARSLQMIQFANLVISIKAFRTSWVDWDTGFYNILLRHIVISLVTAQLFVHQLDLEHLKWSTI